MFSSELRITGYLHSPLKCPDQLFFGKALYRSEFRCKAFHGRHSALISKSLLKEAWWRHWTTCVKITFIFLWIDACRQHHWSGDGGSAFLTHGSTRRDEKRGELTSSHEPWPKAVLHRCDKCEDEACRRATACAWGRGQKSDAMRTRYQIPKSLSDVFSGPCHLWTPLIVGKCQTKMGDGWVMERSANIMTWHI